MAVATRERATAAGSGQGEAATSMGSGQGEAATSAAGATAAHGHAAVSTMAEAEVGLLPRSSFSSHLRGSSLLSFFKRRLGFMVFPFPSCRAQDGSRGERAHLRPTTLKPNMII